MSNIVIYHKSDFDGIFCREIAKKFIPGATLIGWEYGEPVPSVNPSDSLCILDLSVDGLMDHPNLIWIDHHISAIAKHDSNIRGYRIDGVAACRLAWQFFTGSLPHKPDFVNRAVKEPWAVRLAGEYDTWDKRDPDAELFQYGLRSMPLDDDAWHLLLSYEGEKLVRHLLVQGASLQFAKTLENAVIIKANGFDYEWEGLRFLACNHATFNRFLFTAGLRADHDACFGFKWTGTKWAVGLFHAPGKEHHDLSLIAVKHGGGGHRGACGFTADKLPFLS